MLVVLALLIIDGVLPAAPMEEGMRGVTFVTSVLGSGGVIFVVSSAVDDRAITAGAVDDELAIDTELGVNFESGRAPDATSTLSISYVPVPAPLVLEFILLATDLTELALELNPAP